VDENAGKSLSPAFLDRWVDKPTKDLFGSGYAGLGDGLKNPIPVKKGGRMDAQL
jgi:hypothetical protein